jgi:hypothetical protein
MGKYTPLNPIEPKAPETGLGAAARNVYDVGAKIAQAAVGYPINLLGGLGSVVNPILRAAGTPEKVLPQPPSGTQLVKEYGTDPFKKLLFGEAAEKESHPVTETIGDIAHVLTSAFLPPYGATSLKSALGIVGRLALGEAGAQGVKAVGGGEVAQTAGRIGTVVLGTAIKGRYDATQAMKQAYAQSENDIKGKFLSPDLSKIAVHQTDDFTKKLSERALSNKAYLKNANNAIKKVLDQDTVPVKKIWDIKNDINSHIGELNPKSPEFRVASELSNNLDKILRRYGKTNVDFGKNYSTGQEIFKGLNAATQASKFLRENVNLKKLFTKPLYKLIAFNLHPGKLAIGAGLAVSAREAAKLYDLFSRSPKAQQLAADFLKGALQQNAKAVIKSTLGLEREYKEYLPKKYTPID